MTLISQGRDHTDELPVTSRHHVLHRGGVEVVFALSEGLPEVVHWGAPLGTMDADELVLSTRRQVSPSALDSEWPVTVLPGEHEGWEGRPGFAAHRSGKAALPRWRTTEVVSDDDRLRVTAIDEDLRLIIEFLLDDAGVLRVTHELVNTGDDDLDLVALEATMPVGDLASEALDFSGRWTRERSPQRSRLLEGSRVRETRRGRTGHDSPMLLTVGTRAFDNRSGEVWAVHLAWSADAVYRYDALPEASTLIGAGPLLRAGEIVLAPGARFVSPPTAFVWSNRGIDGVADRLHASLRSRAGHPAVRPVTLNTWEAVYFQHDLEPLRALARIAADIGVERFVLDDGWFRGRRHDRAGLGDWSVDPVIWPDGLHPLVDDVRRAGMQFGLWFEPEMVNIDSDLAREHPEWLLQDHLAGVRSWRHQYVLDVANPAVFDYLLDSISRLVTEYELDYIKWDQNRDLIEAVHEGRAAVHRQTIAVYALLEALRLRHPGLEIESCASGGARVDLGILEHTDRVWASDTNDPIERLDIQRWTELLIPLELIGSHVGPPSTHTTGRETTLGLRIAVALFGSFGIEWDISQCSPDELEQLRDAIAAYRRLRGLLHSGVLAHLEGGDDGIRITSVTAHDRSRALVRVARIASSDRALPRLLRLPELDPAAEYLVRPVPELRLPRSIEPTRPPWMERGQAILTGAALAHRGVRLPLLGPGQALVLELEKVPAASEA
ncbi:Alpha-galactosidase [Microbacterium hydrocarbonoxydans]|uniref:alpha-galactosidase n=1 Tax=Microbacterium hydrocarbonoxydans TaxID=273678 RepID=A0A0M2HV06_9MICO|nr:alpha-galactosidase [Microbacterium hydrocarbonoxydans]KJL48289.1 Alpha-galactosidase [Microbacterium hydrocarbonoxydans]